MSYVITGRESVLDMKNYIRLNRYIVGIVTVFIMAILIFCHPQRIQAAKSLPIPDGLVAVKKTETSIRLKWSACKNVDGYYIYRYHKKTGKYRKIKTIEGAKKHVWVDKNRKPNKLYLYKVASYKKKRKSKKSYRVSAMAYGRDARVVNVDSMYFGIEDEDGNRNLELGICAEDKMYTDIEGDRYVKHFDAAVLSEKLIWRSSNPALASVDQTGKIVTYEKEGACEITARAHNGVTGRIYLTVVNYARPKTFPDYDGRFSDVNLLFTDFRENVYDIATYFTIKSKEGVYGKIKLSSTEEVTGYPELENIESIYADVEHILKNFPMVIEIEYSYRRVSFVILNNPSGNSWRRVNYAADDDMSGYPIGRIAPHWSVTTFAGIG